MCPYSKITSRILKLYLPSRHSPANGFIWAVLIENHVLHSAAILYRVGARSSAGLRAARLYFLDLPDGEMREILLLRLRRSLVGAHGTEYMVCFSKVATSYVSHVEHSPSVGLPVTSKLMPVLKACACCFELDIGHGTQTQKGISSGDFRNVKLIWHNI